MFCNKCGNNNSENTPICQRCGSLLENEKKVMNEFENPTIELLKKSQINNSKLYDDDSKKEFSNPNNELSPQNQINNKKGNNKTKFLLIIIALIFVFIIFKIVIKNNVEFKFVLSDVSINMFDTYQLELLAPSNVSDVTYSSSDENIAIVSSDGIVAAKKEGIVIISAYSKDLKTTAKIMLIINKPEQNYIYFENEELILKQGDIHQLQLKANFDFDNKDVVYDISDKKVIDLNADGNLVAKNKGVTFITATLGDISTSLKIEVVTEFVVKFELNGAQSITETEAACTTTDETCKIKLPNIIAPNGYRALGWTVEKDSLKQQYNVLDVIEVKENLILYAVIEKQEIDSIYVNYMINGADSIGRISDSCNKEDGVCKITLPSITKKGGIVIGWSDNKDSKTALYNVNSLIELKNDITLYAITSETKEAKFYYNGAKSLVPSDNGVWSSSNQYISTSCVVYNSQKTCDIYTPKTMVLNNEKDKMLGFSENKTSQQAKYYFNQKVTISNKDNNFYAIYKTAPKNRFTVYFDLNGATSRTDSTSNCYEYGDKCTLTLPNIVRKDGIVIGWSDNKDSKVAKYNVGQTIEVNRDMTLYAITKATKKATFHNNGAKSLTPSDNGIWTKDTSYIQTTCTVYNTETTCDIYTPKSINVDNNYTKALGFSTSKSDTNGSYMYNEKITIDKNMDYYAIISTDQSKNYVSLSKYKFPTVTNGARRKKRVLVIEIDPYLDSKGKKVSQFLEQGGAADLIINNLKSDISYASNNTVSVEIVGREYLNEFPTYKQQVTLLNGKKSYRFDEETYLSVFNNGWYGWWETNNSDFKTLDREKLFDYNYILDKFNLVARKNANEFDEVWMITVDPSSAFETAMVGRSAYWINGEGIIKNCDNFIIAGFTFSRTDSPLECLGHAAEHILSMVFDTPLSYNKNNLNVTSANYNSLNLWQKFTLTDYFNSTDGTGLTGVGAVHFAPNSTGDYDWLNSNYVESSWIDWKNNYPYLTGETSSVNYKTWNSSGDGNYAGRYFHRWWFSLMPHVSGYTNDGYSNNWWDYLYTLDYVVSVSKTNSTYTYNVGDKINNIVVNTKYQSGKTKTESLKKYQQNMIFSNESILKVNGNGEIIAASKGTTNLKYYRDGKYTQITINIK